MEKKMDLYLVHCGFYDPAIGDGIFESHINLFIPGESFEDARKRVRLHPEFKKRGLHIDGFQKIEKVEGYAVQLVKLNTKETDSRVIPLSPADMIAQGMPHD